MIEQSIVFTIILLFTLHTVAHAQWKLIIPILIIGNWMHHRLDQIERIQRTTYAEVSHKPEKVVDQEYQPVSLLESSIQLGKDSITSIQKLLTALGTDGTEIQRKLHESLTSSNMPYDTKEN